MKFFALAILLGSLASLSTASQFPTTEGTTWNYELIQEKPSPNLDLTEPNQTEHFAMSYRLGGVEKIDNMELRRFELYRGDTLESIDLIAIEEGGVMCPARADARGAVVKLIPPQQMLALPMEKGKHWRFDGTIADRRVVQEYKIVGEEEVAVPAGRFHAWRIHCEQTSPAPATIDRWFVPGTGFVKVDTVVKGESGIPAQKTWMNLKELPKVVLTSEKDVEAEPYKFSAGVSTEPTGEFKSDLKLDFRAIYARWHGRELSEHAKVRAVFIAESVENVAADSQIDEVETTSPATNAGGSFTLSRPNDGWNPGSYRLEFYVDGALADTVKFKIIK
ncbi:MAG TPA: hypothetical protein VEH26_01450 [Chthoniobacterales bacterium]|nr:hypothetical protein [Chthoniobacterales bacterium]